MKPTLLLIHSPALGPSTWTGVAEVLRRLAFPSAVPDLRKMLAEGPPFYPRLAAAAAGAIPGGGGMVVLVGHSAAGALLPAIAEAIARPVRGVFVDAQLPHPGVSWLGAAPPALRQQLIGLSSEGLLPPWHEWFPPAVLEQMLPDARVRRAFIAEVPRVPLAYFEEAAPVTRRLGRRWAYLRCSEPYDAAADEADRRGWWVARRNWDHLRMVSAPEMVADLVVQAVSNV